MSNDKSVESYPKEWQTNKNLRWWLSQQEGDIVTTEDDRYVHEAMAVEFAKQFHKKEIDRLTEKLENTLTHISGLAGHPNAVEGCRNIVKYIRELKEK